MGPMGYESGLLAIAHNGNLANGIMFPLNAQYDDKRFDQTYVQ